MRIVFMGTPDFAVPTLQALVAAGHDIAAVYSQPPRAAGRGLALRKSPVQQAAEQAALPVRHPERLKGEAEQELFRDLGAQVGVVVAYGLILPKTVIEAPTHGCLNVHASLLPRWRGAAPINRAIMAGDQETGISVMRIEPKLDAGPVCSVRAVPIGQEETAGELHDRLAALGARLMVDALADLQKGKLHCHPQLHAAATYAAKIDPAEAEIDWRLPARVVHDRIRGLSPYPGAWFQFDCKGKPERLKVSRSALAEGAGPPGTLLDGDFTVACGEGAVRLMEVQRAGKRALPAQDFLRGTPLAVGTLLS
jgi:methionyl-tRNA formyltransferase